MPQQLYRLSLGGALLLAATVLFPPPASAWQFTASRGDQTFEGALDVGVDERTGHVVAGGRLFAPGSGSTFFAAKMNRQHGHEIWRFELPSAPSGSVWALALGPEGDVVLAGRARGEFTVVELDKDSGVPNWIARLPGGTTAFDVEVDPNGDVIAAGFKINSGMLIVKFDGEDGSELWRAEPSGAVRGGSVRSLALDATGDAVVAGSIRNAAFQSTFTVIKVAGSDGGEVWRHTIEPNSVFSEDGAIAVEVDPFGDAVAIGHVRVFADPGFPSELVVLKVAGVDGARLWRRDLSPGQRSDVPRSLALDAAGDVVAAGNFGSVAGIETGVVKLDGEDGAEIWRHLDDGRDADRVTVDPVGDVIVAGAVLEGRDFDMGVKKLAGATGDLLWRVEVADEGAGGSARGVATDAAGNAIVGGSLRGAAIDPDFAVVKRDGATGEDFQWPEHRSPRGRGR